jgi:pyruvate kinase
VRSHEPSPVNASGLVILSRCEGLRWTEFYRKNEIGADVPRLLEQMQIYSHKTKIVATIGPASTELPVLVNMVEAGMSIARLNFSHGDFAQHERVVANIREASSQTGLRVAIMADLPGPKMRLGEISRGPIELECGQHFVLTSEAVDGSLHRVSMSFEPLPGVVRPGDRLFLNDGLVQLIVERVEGPDVHCKVVVGGTISSRKGLNLPRIPLGISAFTLRDKECLEFALSLGVDAISQSFVEKPSDIEEVRAAASACGAQPFIIAKIERFEALENYSGILKAADGVMVARGDLGVEVPIEEMAVTQKKLIAQARMARKPVITATQMLESMTMSRLPTRAEATDVANAILDGTDCIMLSAESAAGRFPVESVQMLARIAQSAEKFRESYLPRDTLALPGPEEPLATRKALLVEHAIAIENCDAVLVPSHRGGTARAVSRWRPSTWTVAIGIQRDIMQHLQFSYGVLPVDADEFPEDWNHYAEELSVRYKLPRGQWLLIAGPSPRNPNANQRLELIVFNNFRQGPVS